ncbi:MAG: hypothetical protein L3J07_02655 [Candidatus Magasanikbacteria bacterium]|nr:hypothetical protein [Candidatus Magasanikbacteria bacterium]
MKNKHKNKVHLFVILIWPIFATIISFLLNVNYLISILLFFGVPSFYLSYINRRFVLKVLVYSFIFAIPISIILDYIAIMSGVWFMPISILDPFRFFGLIVAENLLWVYLWTYFIIMFYETFLDKHLFVKTYYPKIKYLIFGLTTLVFGIILIHFVNPLLLKINFAYFKFGIITTFIPISFVYFKFPKLRIKLVKIGAYFFVFSLLHEIVGLALNQWVFPPETLFVGWVYLFGLQFPLEELVFFMVLGAMAIVSFYEIFNDDGK